MTPQHLEGIADDELLDAVRRAAASERDATVELLALLGEVDVRKLYLGQGCASLFTYCTQVLHLSEHAAYHRIEGARAARQFPRVLDLLSSGALTLTTVGLLRQILTADNANEVLEAAAFKSKRVVEVLVAGLAPKPDVPTVVRRIPGVATLPLQCGAAPPTNCQPGPADTPHGETAVGDDWAVPRSTTSPRPVASPLSRDRFLLRVTISADTHAKLRRAQDLLRHSIPSGDPAAVIGRALTMLVDHLERAKTGQARRSRPPKSDTAPPVNTRHIPRAVRRAVWQRDEGRCTFAGPHGRCGETAWLELHHIVAFARGGPTEVANLTLRCRAHNQFEAMREFGPSARQPREQAVALPL